jgi:hypothetical protein
MTTAARCMRSSSLSQVHAAAIARLPRWATTWTVHCAMALMSLCAWRFAAMSCRPAWSRRTVSN